MVDQLAGKIPLARREGQKIGVSSWVTMDLERIARFGELTDDVEPLHVDPEWCRVHSPYGHPIAYGFLTLSMLTKFVHEVTGGEIEGKHEKAGFPLNYGFDRIRFLAPVPAGGRIRGHVTLLDASSRAVGEVLYRFAVSVEIEGQERPALVAEWLCLFDDTALEKANPAP